MWPFRHSHQQNSRSARAFAPADLCSSKQAALCTRPVLGQARACAPSYACHLEPRTPSPPRGRRPKVKPNGRLVPVSSARRRASTPGLSTSWSTTDLQGILILWSASRLDAFSGYPFQTWLPGDASGKTTGTPGVCPSRSSRTRDRSTSRFLRPRQIGTKLSHDVLNPARVPL